jgi:hypothetical protein
MSPFCGKQNVENTDDETSCQRKRADSLLAMWSESMLVSNIVAHHLPIPIFSYVILQLWKGLMETTNKEVGNELVMWKKGSTVVHSSLMVPDKDEKVHHTSIMFQSWDCTSCISRVFSVESSICVSSKWKLCFV